MPNKDGTGPDGNGPKKINPGIPTPRRRKTVSPTRKPGPGGGRRNRGQVWLFRDNW